MDDREQTERRIAAFVAAGLDDFRIRAWTVDQGRIPTTQLRRPDPGALHRQLKLPAACRDVGGRTEAGPRSVPRA